MISWKKVKKEEEANPTTSSKRRRKLEVHDLGLRFSVEEKLCKDVFRLERDTTNKIEEALANEDYGAVGKYLKEFYLKVCELIDEAKAEIVRTTP